MYGMYMSDKWRETDSEGPDKCLFPPMCIYVCVCGYVCIFVSEREIFYICPCESMSACETDTKFYIYIHTHIYIASWVFLPFKCAHLLSEYCHRTQGQSCDPHLSLLIGRLWVYTDRQKDRKKSQISNKHVWVLVETSCSLIGLGCIICGLL